MRRVEEFFVILVEGMVRKQKMSVEAEGLNVIVWEGGKRTYTQYAEPHLPRQNKRLAT
jgi:hypothetical protein